MASEVDTTAAKPRNWWKIGFFLALIAFELARETAVLEEAELPRLGVLANVYTSGGWTVAEGKWERLDGGDRLIPVSIRIQCAEALGECTQAAVTVYKNVVDSPTIKTFKANFSPDLITYQDAGVCATSITRIDLKLKRVFSVREMTKNPNAECAGLERRIESQLADGWRDSDFSTAGHFVPLVDAIRWLTQ